MRAKASPALQDHPVIGRLAQFKSILNRITSEKTQDYSKVYLEIYEDLREQRNDKEEDQEDLNEDQEDGADHLADFEALTGGKKMKLKPENEDGEESEYDEDGKRKITYKMSKNKGFIPKRQKKRRNPRVKHRGTFSQSCKPFVWSFSAILSDRSGNLNLGVVMLTIISLMVPLRGVVGEVVWYPK